MDDLAAQDPGDDGQDAERGRRSGEELFPDELSASLDDPDYANSLLNRAQRRALEAASEPQAGLARWDVRRTNSVYLNYFRMIRDDLKWLPIWPPTLGLQPQHHRLRCCRVRVML